MSDLEIVEIDYRPFLSKDKVPEALEVDLRRCDALWVSFPQIPKNPSIGVMQWDWGWAEWKYTGGPSIPRQAIFDESVLIHADDSASLLPKAEEAISALLLSRPKKVSFALLLRVGEKYVQGIVPGQPGFQAQLRRSYVLLGKRQE